MAEPLLTSELDRCVAIAAVLAEKAPARYRVEAFAQVLRELLGNESDDDLECRPATPLDAAAAVAWACRAQSLAAADAATAARSRDQQRLAAVLASAGRTLDTTAEVLDAAMAEERARLSRLRAAP